MEVMGEGERVETCIYVYKKKDCLLFKKNFY